MTDEEESKWWFECWYSEGGDYHLPRNILYVSPALDLEGGIVVLATDRQDTVLFRGADYDEVREYLLEDDYQLINGRVYEIGRWTIGVIEYDLRRMRNGLEPIAKRSAP